MMMELDVSPCANRRTLPLLADRPLYLLLDSGASVPYLCESSRGSVSSVGGRPMHIAGSNGPGRDFVVLPAQDMRIGNNIVHQVSFVVTVSHSTAKMQVDGTLPTGLFRRVYISYQNHFMILEPW